MPFAIRAGAWAASALLGAAAGAAVLAPGPAGAHPFGDPQTVDVAVDAQRPEVVHVHWRVGGPDDLTLLGVSLGLLPRDRVKTDGTVDVQYDDPGVLAASDRFAAYLTERITVTDGAAPCPGTVQQPIGFLQLKGATADYTCPGPVATATVAVRMLTDLNPAYRTLATGPNGQRAVYEGGADTHAWTLTGPPPAGGAGLGRSAAVQLAAVLGGLLLAGAGAEVVARRMRRRAVAA
ncbi:hypothetical protein [Dactylosporangium darangshiense]|uniref:hypothetical protein n=1 Tax=Dactylosporangium darangshiense TaxID=579108 RepID=UPI0031EEB984